MGSGNNAVKIIESLTSDLMRSKETAQIVSHVVLQNLGIELNFKELPDLREYHAGDLANYTLQEYSKIHEGVMENYFKQYALDPWDARYPGKDSESWNMVSKRISGLLKKLNESFISYILNTPTWDTVTLGTSKNIYIWSTHGGIIANFLQLMSVDTEKENLVLGNGDVLVLVPVVDYRQVVLSSAANEFYPIEGTRIPISQVIEHGCFVSWKVIKHAKVGDAITAKSDLESYIK